MQTYLRPLSLGEILDRTAQLYRSNFLVFAGIFSIYASVGLILNLAQIGLGAVIRRGHMPQGISWPVIAAGVMEWTILLLLLGAGIAAINRAVAWVYLGEPATIRRAYASTLPRFGRYLWLMTVTSALAWLPFALAYSGYVLYVFVYVRPKGVFAHPNTGVDAQAMIVVLATIGFLLLIFLAFVYGVLMSLRYALAVPACVIEDLTARNAIRRSVSLSKGARGRIFVLFLLIAVIKLGLVGITQASFIVMVFKNHGEVAPWVSAISQVLAFFTNTFIGPIGGTGVALFYYDQRIRKEGYDIEWMMQTAGWVVPNLPSDAVELSPSPVDPPSEMAGAVSPDLPPATSG